MTDELRQARHELRTPVNHILSYARLVAEEAADLALHDLVPMLEAIQAAGAEALSRIDAVLGQNSQPERLALHELARQIGEQAEQLGARAVAGGHGQLAEDARRISDAAGRLLALEDGGEAGRLGKSDEPSNAWKPAPTPDPVGAGFQQPLPDTDHPNLPDRRPPSPAARERGPGGEGLPATLLVVDDNEANRDVLSRSLSRLGYRVLRAEDGQVALDMLANDDVDLVLLDIMMPVLDGYAVLERRRADHRLLGIPFIVISATGDDASVIRCIEMGAEDYLPKPFDPVLLRARIGACLEKKRLHDQERRHLATIEAQAAALAEWSQTLERRVAEQITRLERLTSLTRFLPPQLAETIVDAGDESLLARHRRQIAVVFCDLRGFTPFSETAEPEEVMDVLGEYHATMGELIARHAGTVEHFAGDGLMVLFNDPLPCPEPEAEAVRMAVAMRDRMLDLTAAWRRNGHTLGFGVGITYGYATLGRIGFESRLHYAAIGSVVNLASRLCGEAKNGQILASQRVGLAVEAVAEVRPAGDLALKGFRDPVPAVEIVGLRAS
ncbi:MAG: response regulator [Chloroflexota bacterium]